MIPLFSPSGVYFFAVTVVNSYPHREVGYLPEPGAAIRLELPPRPGHETNQIYVFICENPEKVKNLLLGKNYSEASEAV